MVVRKVVQYLRSNRFKNRLYTVGMLSLMGYATFLLFTLNKPMFKPKRAETAGYDNYDDD